MRLLVFSTQQQSNVPRMKTADLGRAKYIHWVPKCEKNKTKHRLPAKGQIILEKRCDGKQEIEGKERNGTLFGEIPRRAQRIYPEHLH